MNMQEEILNLRRKGLSYNQITKELGCAKSTVCYYCGNNQKTKNITRGRKLRAKKHHDLRTTLFKKISHFKKAGGHKWEKYIDFYEKLYVNPVCHLTGDEIDLKKGRSYHLDHVIPISKGGIGTIDNCELATKGANAAKHDLMLGEFVDLCIKVCRHFGYTVTK